MDVEIETPVTPYDFTELEKVKFISHDEGPYYAVDFVTLSEKEFSFVKNVSENN